MGLSVQDQRWLYDYFIGGAPQAKLYQKISVTGSATGLTYPDGSTSALITIVSTITSGPAVMYLETGVNPTATDGMPQYNGSSMEVLGPTNLANFKIIQAGAGTHTAHVTYYIQ